MNHWTTKPAAGAGMRMREWPRCAQCLLLALAMGLLWSGNAVADNEIRITSSGLQIEARLQTIPLHEVWHAEVKRFREANADVKPGLTLLVGDSITAAFPVEQLFPGGNVVKRGISGDTIEGLSRRLDESIFDLKPTKIFLLIGINNIFHTSVQDYANLYNYLFARVKAGAPEAGIYVQSLMPANKNILAYAEKVKDVNQVQAALAKQYGFTYVDLTPALADKQGRFDEKLSPDGVHPNAAGYERWKSVLDRHLAE